MGQSNMAAGATIGSNHNSRATDGEIVAGRGFWPGLCTSIKHSSKFASFTLLAKSDFPHELNIKLPFSLVNNNQSTNELEIMPAFWWMYNMYAIARNTSKYQKRDKRKRKIQNIEFETFAPDTMEEAIEARKLLEGWTGKAFLMKQGEFSENMDFKELRKIGRNILQNMPEIVDSLEVFGEGMEHGNRKVRILKCRQAYTAYGDMITYYAVKNIVRFLEQNPSYNMVALREEMECKRQREWINLGGQLMNGDEVEKLIHDINNGILDSWDDIHHRYDEIWQRYPVEKLRHAYMSLVFLHKDECETLTPDLWQQSVKEAKRIQKFICDQVYMTRKKDYDNEFRNSTFRNEAEKIAVVGEIDEVSFVKEIRNNTEDFISKLEKYEKWF